jgi:protein-tyrosine phosphatase
MRRLGLDITAHRPRLLSAELLSTDGADLVIAMTREHLRAAAVIAPDVFPRAFTAPELARRITDGFHVGSLTMQQWVAAVGAGRRARDLVGLDTRDDVADPYGMPPPAHADTVAQLSALMGTIARALPGSCPTR